jgi:hypothetical protein
MKTMKRTKLARVYSQFVLPENSICDFKERKVPVATAREKEFELTTKRKLVKISLQAKERIRQISQ